MVSDTNQLTTNQPAELNVSFAFIKSNAELSACCKQWQLAEFLALDTEFIRTSTFYPKVGLIQLSDGQDIVLIDPLEIDEWEPFRLLMLDINIVKIFHSCSEDLLVFFAFLNILPTPLYDTQIGAALTDNLFGISYQNLVKNSHGIELPKGETRSDWLQRPLTQEQLSYAALDVHYLPDIYRSQMASLTNTQRNSWLKEECERIPSLYQSEFTADFSQYYLNVKRAWQLSPVQLAALQKLATWREQRARKRNKPRNWIIKDKPLYEIATGMPSDKRYLLGIETINENFVHHEGDSLVALVDEARMLPESECPAQLPKPLTSSQKKMLKNAQLVVEQKAIELNIPAELLARKRSLMGLFYIVLDESFSEQELVLPEEFNGWRGPLILEQLLEIFQK